MDKLNRMEQVIQIAGFSELNIQEDITVIVVAENKIEMEHIEKLLENKQKIYSHLQLATTYDRLIIFEDLPLEKRIHPRQITTATSDIVLAISRKKGAILCTLAVTCLNLIPYWKMRSWERG